MRLDLRQCFLHLALPYFDAECFELTADDLYARATTPPFGLGAPEVHLPRNNQVAYISERVGPVARDPADIRPILGGLGLACGLFVKGQGSFRIT